jgi:hypothetical protein
VIIDVRTDCCDLAVDLAEVDRPDQERESSAVDIIEATARR